MSLFLGKIHYWLFNKIVWFEGLEQDLLVLAKNEGLDVENIVSENNKNFGEKLPNLPLEDIIDTSNIHGWLQSKIHSAEGRVASLTVKLLAVDNIEEKIKNIYVNQGIKAANEVKAERDIENAIEIFSAINDYILDGMPCDRVNEVIEQEEDKVTWVRTLCVHKNIWANANADVNYFYDLRDEWVKTFVKELNEKFEYVKLEDTKMQIRRV